MKTFDDSEFCCARAQQVFNLTRDTTHLSRHGQFRGPLDRDVAKGMKQEIDVWMFLIDCCVLSRRRRSCRDVVVIFRFFFASRGSTPRSNTREQFLINSVFSRGLFFSYYLVM